VLGPDDPAPGIITIEPEVPSDVDRLLALDGPEPHLVRAFTAEEVTAILQQLG
jgi:hypothetical protein